MLILTARDAVFDSRPRPRHRPDDYLVKPFELAELFARLRRIRRAAGVAAPAVRLGNVVVDTRSRTVMHDDKSVRLTAREYALVELLALHRGEVVTRTQIYDHLFDENDDSLSNLVDVHVSNIRRKLGKDFIVTRRGLGYVVDG